MKKGWKCLLFAFCLLPFAFCFFHYYYLSFNQQPNHWYEEGFHFLWANPIHFDLSSHMQNESPTVTSSATTTTTLWSTKSLSLIHYDGFLWLEKWPHTIAMCSHVCVRINARSVVTHKVSICIKGRCPRFVGDRKWIS